MIKIVGVRFRNAGKVYYFDPRDLELKLGDHVIAETSKGPEYGTVSTRMKMVEDEQVSQPLRAVARKATAEDEEQVADLRAKEKEALRACREKVREHGLDMKMVDAEYSFDAGKVLFYFTADGRVDFRNLVKDLASMFHVRIELRQIGVRDETRMLGGIGTCGRELCCATFLRDFQPVSIKMAKEQNLSLNPAKISGTCGRLMCCLKNEEETYEFLNAKMPKMGEEATTADGQVGKVIELDVLRQRVRVLFEEGDTKEIEVFPVGELTFRPRKKKDPSAQGNGKGKKGEKNDKNRQGEEREKPGKGERAENRERAEKSERTENRERAEKSERTENRERAEKSERIEDRERTERGSRAEGHERNEKGSRAESRERSERSSRPQDQERPRKNNRTERTGAERTDRERTGAGRADRERTGAERADRERTGAERADRDHDGGRSDKNRERRSAKGDRYRESPEHESGNEKFRKNNRRKNGKSEKGFSGAENREQSEAPNRSVKDGFRIQDADSHDEDALKNPAKKRRKHRPHRFDQEAREQGTTSEMKIYADRRPEKK